MKDDAAVEGTEGWTRDNSLELRVAGMDCASCAASVESALLRLGGVRDVRVDVVGGRVRVKYTEGTIGPDDLAGAIRRVGYRVETRAAGEGAIADGVGDAVVSPSWWELRGRLMMTAAAAALLIVGIALKWADTPRVVWLSLLALSTVAGGWFVVPRGVRAAMNRALDMNFLMSVAAAGAWIIGEPTEAAATLCLFAIAELLESLSMDRARNAIRALMELSPAEATVRRDGAEMRVSAVEVGVGEIVVVRPGEKIAVDGTVVSGRSSVNQAAITGESMPVDKAIDDEVFAGSLNRQGALDIRSTKPASDTTLARIVHAVEEAQATRAPSQRFVDRFARIYTPAVVVVAALLAVVPPLLGLGGWSDWIYRALTMLVVACPCALVISTPVSIVNGLAGAARGGVLIKGGVHLENLGRVGVICLDKTGTLTVGRPAVAMIVALNGGEESDVLRLALAVEHWSEHPIARAIAAAGVARSIETPASTEFEAIISRGARARVDREIVQVGNTRMLAELGEVEGADVARDALTRMEREGMTAVVVVRDRRAVGVLGIADQVRTNARAALSDLREAGLHRIVMLTGDNESAARTVAARVGVNEVHAQLLPDDKVRVVRDLEAGGQRVVFVGDGVNDAPALAAATVGIAMGAAGTDVALETADVALMADDLQRLAFAIRLSRRTLGIIRQNVALALAIKAVFLVLAVGGWATLWMAVAADMGGSLIVVANGLRARRTE